MSRLNNLKFTAKQDWKKVSGMWKAARWSDRLIMLKNIYQRVKICKNGK